MDMGMTTAVAIAGHGHGRRHCGKGPLQSKLLQKDVPEGCETLISKFLTLRTVA